MSEYYYFNMANNIIIVSYNACLIDGVHFVRVHT